MGRQGQGETTLRQYSRSWLLRDLRVLYSSGATAAVETVRRPQTIVAFVGQKLVGKAGLFANFIHTGAKPNGNKSEGK